MEKAKENQLETSNSCNAQPNLKTHDCQSGFDSLSPPSLERALATSSKLDCLGQSGAIARLRKITSRCFITDKTKVLAVWSPSYASSRGAVAFPCP
eukprot:2710144-Amphidinium_carterae.1